MRGLTRASHSCSMTSSRITGATSRWIVGTQRTGLDSAEHFLFASASVGRPRSGRRAESADQPDHAAAAHLLGSCRCARPRTGSSAASGRRSGQIVRLVLGLLVVGSAAVLDSPRMVPSPGVHWLYNGRYDEYASLLWILGMVPILYAGELIFNSVLRSRERPDQIFWASVMSTVTALTVGVALILPGACEVRRCRAALFADREPRRHDVAMSKAKSYLAAGSAWLKFFTRHGFSSGGQKSMKVLVTGHDGYIGRVMVPLLQGAGTLSLALIAAL